MLDHLCFALCRFYLIPRQCATLPADESIGALLRDRFGSALKHTVCPFPRGPCRTRCIMPRQCAYARLFETTRERICTGGNPASQDVYRPFVLEPPLDGKHQYTPGEMLPFNLVLVGEAIDALPYFVAAFEEMGRHGLGMERTRWHVERVVSVTHSTAPDGVLIFDGRRQQFTDGIPVKNFAAVTAESERLSDTCIALELITPLRIGDQGELAHEISASILIRALMRRLTLLAYTWCEEPRYLDYRPLLNHLVSRVTCEAAPVPLPWEDWQHDSARQRAKLKLGGLRGRLVLRGDLTELRPFLKLGEYLHIGKQTVFGLGKYICQEGPVRNGDGFDLQGDPLI